jgi:hypothetical protein
LRREDLRDLGRVVWGFHSVKMDLCETVKGKLVWLNDGGNDDDEEDDVIWAVANVAAILLTEAAIINV